MDQPSSQPPRLDARLLSDTKFVVAWVGVLAVFLLFVGWPLRNIALVLWVYGSRGYFDEGIRVLPGKPIRFSNGVEAPTLPDLVTGFGAFFITVLGLTLLLIYGLRFYERHFGNREDSGG